MAVKNDKKFEQFITNCKSGDWYDECGEEGWPCYFAFETAGGQFVEAYAHECYGSLRKEGVGIVRARVWLCEANINWVDYIINSPLFSRAFLTHDAQEGLSRGFWLDCSCPANILMGAIITLRLTTEYSVIGNTFQQICELGRPVEEAVYFSVCFPYFYEGDLDIVYDEHGLEFGLNYKLSDFLEGKVYHEDKPFKELGRSSYCGVMNALSSPGRDAGSYYGFLAQQLGLSKTQGIFGDPEYHIPCTNDNMVNIINIIRKDEGLA